mgnify:CR=1 FL=1
MDTLNPVRRAVPLLRPTFALTVTHLSTSSVRILGASIGVVCGGLGRGKEGDEVLTTELPHRLVARVVRSRCYPPYPLATKQIVVTIQNRPTLGSVRLCNPCVVETRTGTDPATSISMTVEDSRPTAISAAASLAVVYSVVLLGWAGFTAYEFAVGHAVATRHSLNPQELKGVVFVILSMVAGAVLLALGAHRLVVVT